MKLAGRSLTVFLAGAGTARALTVGAGPPIRLRPYTLRLHRDPEKVLAELRAQLEDAPNVLVRSGDSLVASFAGRAGALRYRTVELVRFSDRQVTFEHLSGPFRSAQESFDVVSLPSIRDAVWPLRVDLRPARSPADIRGPGGVPHGPARGRRHFKSGV